MKYFLFTLTALFVTHLPLFADEHNFEAHKADVLKNIDERMTKLAEHKTCVTAATDPKAMKECREKMKEWMKAEKEERREHRRERMKDKKD